MKGVVFDMLRDMVEEHYGLEGWQAVLEESGSDGLYLSTETYDDDELLGLVNAASVVSGVVVNDLVFAFGRFMVGEFYKRFPGYFDASPSLLDFLLSVDQVIHTEVRKLYPDAQLPEFRYDQTDAEQLVMEYRSPRKLCRLAEGLIDGSAHFFKQNYQLDHSVCMHKGDDCCRLAIRLC